MSGDSVRSDKVCSDSIRSISQIVDLLRQNTPVIQEKQILAGFDGFIDTIVKPVRLSGTNGSREFFRTIAEFGEFITNHSHKSTSIQFEIQQRKPGGNLANYAAALDALLLPTIVVGMLSNEAGIIDPLFEKIGKQRYSYLAAGSATALEFEDGKIFFSSIDVPGICREEKIFPRIENVFPDFRSTIAGADLIAFLNWSELPFAHDLWNDIYNHALISVKADKNRFAFFDLCDTSAKNLSEIEALTLLIGKIGECRKTILSMNKNEALDIAGKITGRNCTIEETAEFICSRFGLDEVIIHQHTTNIAVSAEEGMVTEPCLVNSNPKISTGAGDHFNAAYCYTCLSGLSIAEKLRFATAYSGTYIALGKSPRLEDLEK